MLFVFALSFSATQDVISPRMHYWVTTTEANFKTENDGFG